MHAWVALRRRHAAPQSRMIRSFPPQVIVTTPEKWDVVTRKGGDGSLVSSVGLIMIDEARRRRIC